MSAIFSNLKITNFSIRISTSRFAPSNLADTVQPVPAAYIQPLVSRWRDVKLHHAASRALHGGTLDGRAKRSKAF